MQSEATSGRRLRRALSRLPLAATGALRRFAEDPARGRAALDRAVPALRRSGDSIDVKGRLDRAVADDRYLDAEALLAQIPATDPERESCALAVRRIAGDLSEVAASHPTDARGRRARTLARGQMATLRAALPSWAYVSPQFEERGDGPARVLHVVTNSLPLTQAGSTIRTQRIAQAQRDVGWDAQVVTRPGYPVLYGVLDAPSIDNVDGVPYRRILPLTMPAANGVSEAYRKGLQRIVGEWQPHVLHAASDHVNAQAALEVGRRAGIPVAYEVRSFHEDTWLARHPGAEHSDTYRWMRQRHSEVMRAADIVTTLGPAMRDEIVERGVDPARIYLTPNAVPLDYLAARDRDVARRKLGLADAYWIGSIATITEYEGFATLIDAVAELRRQGLDARILLVGDGPALASLKAQASARDVPLTAPGRVPVARVRDYYDALDVFALPRSDVALNRRVTALKPLEALARGVPVVGSDLPAIAEVLPPGTPLVPPGDAQALAGALGVLADPTLRGEQGDLGHAWVASCRTWPYVTEVYRTAYASLGVPTA